MRPEWEYTSAIEELVELRAEVIRLRRVEKAVLEAFAAEYGPPDTGLGPVWADGIWRAMRGDDDTEAR